MSDDLQTQSAAAAHARSWNLLPWLVNGTLSFDQANAVERHLTECAACAKELGVQRALQLQLRDGNPVSLAPQSAWLKMAERLASEDEALTQGYFTSRSNTVKHWRWVVAAQALIIVGLATLLWQQAHAPKIAATQVDAALLPRYQTLTSTAATTTASPNVVRVVFRSDIALASVNALLSELRAQIVAGPTEAGVYTLALTLSPERDKDRSDPAASMLARLRADSRVVFAEPAGSN